MLRDHNPKNQDQLFEIVFERYDYFPKLRYRHFLELGNEYFFGLKHQHFPELGNEYFQELKHQHFPELGNEYFFSFLYNQINELFNGAISKHFNAQMIVFLICVINEFQVLS